MYPLAVVPSALKTGLGIYQTLRGALMKDPKRPVRGVTSATQQQLARAEGMANRSSDVVLSSELSDINRSASGAVGNLTKSVGNTSELLAGLGSIESSKARARSQAYGGFGERKYSYENQLLRAYDALRNEQMNAWQWNQGDKYIEEMTKKQALLGSGISNINTGLSEFSTVGLYDQLYGSYEKLGGKKKSPKAQYGSPVY